MVADRNIYHLDLIRAATAQVGSLFLFCFENLYIDLDLFTLSIFTVVNTRDRPLV